MTERIHLVGQLQEAGGRPKNVDLVVNNPEDILVYASDALNRVYERIEAGKAYYAESPTNSETITIENPASSGVKVVIYAISNPGGGAGAITYGYDTAASTSGSVTEINLLTEAADSGASVTHQTTQSNPSTVVGSVTPASSATDPIELASPIAISEGDFFQAAHATLSAEVGVYFYEI